MKLEDMPVVTAEQVIRFRQEAIAQCISWRARFDAVQGDQEGTLANWKKTIDQRNQLSAQVEGMRSALQHIAEYWNRDENDKAMADALWHIIDEANDAITTTPSHSLAQHDAELLERMAVEFSRYELTVYASEGLKQRAARIRAEAGGDGE